MPDGHHIAASSDPSSDSDDEPLAADHPDYFGRGWQPSKAQPAQPPADASANVSKSGQWDSISADGSDSDDEVRNTAVLSEISTSRDAPPEE